MGMPRFDHVSFVVNDLDTATAFFLELGFEQEGRALVEGEAVDKINRLQGVRAELVMVSTLGGSGKLELVKYHSPADGQIPDPSPANRLGLRHIAIEVADLDATLARLRAQGYDTLGEVREFGGTYKLCYIRGPEALIVELAERVSP